MDCKMDPQTLMTQIGPLNLAAVGARTFVHDAKAKSLMFEVGAKRGQLRKVIVTLENDDTYSVRYVVMGRKCYSIITDDRATGITSDNIGRVVREMGDQA